LSIHSLACFLTFYICNRSLLPFYYSSIITVYVDLLASRKFDKPVGNHCWHYFNLARSCCCYTCNCYETTYIGIGGRVKNHQLKSLPNYSVSTYELTFCLCTQFIAIFTIPLLRNCDHLTLWLQKCHDFNWLAILNW